MSKFTKARDEAAEAFEDINGETEEHWRERMAFKAGADWAIHSEVVKGLVTVLKCSQAEFEARGGQGFLGAAIEAYMISALAAFDEATKREGK